MNLYYSKCKPFSNYLDCYLEYWSFLLGEINTQVSDLKLDHSRCVPKCPKYVCTSGRLHYADFIKCYMYKSNSLSSCNKNEFDGCC